MDFPPARVSFVDWAKVNRTRTGLLLLLFGLIMGALPVISTLGGILSIVGAVLVITGRDAFGPVHARNTIISLGVYMIGFVILLAGVASFTSNIVAVLATNTGKITDAFNGLFLTIIVSVVFTGAGTVFLTYALQDSIGRLLLWIAYAVEIVIAVLVELTVSPLLSAAVNTAAATRSTAPILALQSQLQFLQLFNIFPALAFALAYYLAIERIDREEIPEAARATERITSPSIQTGH